MVIYLRREIIGFRFTKLAGQGRHFIIMVYVVRKWSHVIEKFRIHRPALMFVPDTVTNYLSLKFINSVLQQKLLFLSVVIEYDETQPFRSEEHTSELQSLMRISYA